MSGISDIRMYVEHLFEGRTLDAETIELKEEIYGNLVARYEDYLAQGMTEAEAYRRTCEAVTSVEDVMGEKDGDAATDPTVVAPAVAAAKETGTREDIPPAPTAEADAPQKRRWSTGVIAAVAIACVLVAGMVVMTAFGLLKTDDARNAYDSSTDATVQQVDEPDGTTYTDQNRGDAVTTNTQAPSTTTTQQPQDGPVDSDTLLVTDELDDLIRSNDPSSYASLAQGSALDVMASLPLGYHVASAEAGAQADELLTEYDFGKDERLVYFDDDAVERALTYDAAVVFCSMPGVNTWTVTLVETDLEDRDVDVDRYSFRRSDLEHLLGVTLDESQLGPSAWSSVRDQLMSKRVWDEATDRAERD